MATGYAKLLGLHKQYSDEQIITMLKKGTLDIEDTHIEVAKPRRVTVPYGDPFA